jgi:hypothetical protein
MLSRKVAIKDIEIIPIVVNNDFNVLTSIILFKYVEKANICMAINTP